VEYINREPIGYLSSETVGEGRNKREAWTVVPFEDGDMVVNPDGIIEDICAVNKLLQKSDRESV
jgi:hypothetical protein